MSGPQKYLYIVSSPHGGSTLLSLVLGNHALATNLGEASFIPKLLALGELCTCGAKLGECAHWGAVFDRLAAQTGCDLRASPYGLYLGEALKGKDGSGLIDTRQQTQLRYLFGKLRGALDTATLLATPAWPGMGLTTLPSVRASVRNTLALYAAAAAACSSRLVVDASKLPRKAPHLYLRDPARVRILHLVRDARGVAASRKKYMQVERAAERWHHYHWLTQRLLERWVPAPHRLRLRYEDFVAAPEQHMRSLCDWLELPYDPGCLQFGTDFVTHSAGGNPARFGLANGIRPGDERWKTVLTTADLATVEQHAGRLQAEFGYA